MNKKYTVQYSVKIGHLDLGRRARYTRVTLTLHSRYTHVTLRGPVTKQGPSSYWNTGFVWVAHRRTGSLK
jgi:hypothetical protein